MNRLTLSCFTGTLRRHALVGVLFMASFAASAAPAAAQGGEVIEYYGVDAIGSIRVVFDVNGNVLARNDYVPFGESFTPSGPLPSEQFTGQARDGEAGLDYFGARFYQPRHGRFSSVDPVFGNIYDPQALNRYRYARNNPINLIDPTGLFDANGGCPTDYCETVNVLGYITGSPSKSSGNLPIEPWFGWELANAWKNKSWIERERGELDPEPSAPSSDTATSTLDVIQDVLDIAGLVPGAGEVADAANAAISYSRGDSVGASLSVAAMVPLGGQSATVAKVARKVADWLGPNFTKRINKWGDTWFMSEDGLRKVRFDINHPHPHPLPHANVEEKIGGKWINSGPVYPEK